MKLFARLFIHTATLTTLLLMVGCTDMLTYATENRQAGVQAFNQGNYPEAVGAFRNATRQDPRDFQSHCWLGLASIELQNYSQAIAAFQTCLETRQLTPFGMSDKDTYNKAIDGYARAIVASDNTDVEVNRLETAARNTQGEKSAESFFILAKVYRQRKLPDMSLDYYNRACQQDTRNFDFQKEFGLYAEQLQQNAKAEQALRRAYAVKSTDPEVSQALTRIGVVVGPSLLNKDDLNSPILPKGPIPEVDMNKVKSALGIPSDNPPATNNNTTITPSPGNTAATPRD